MAVAEHTGLFWTRLRLVLHEVMVNIPLGKERSSPPPVSFGLAYIALIVERSTEKRKWITSSKFFVGHFDYSEQDQYQLGIHLSVVKG